MELIMTDENFDSDTKKVLASIEQLPNQIQDTWSQLSKLTFSIPREQIKHIVVCGMGGSIIGADVLRSVFSSELSVPIFIVSDYHLPSFVGKESLVILSSYSGTTEEVLSCAQEAKERNAFITGITQGGTLATFLTSERIPSLIFTPTYNPSQQPRLALGYSIFGQIGLLAKIGMISLSNETVSSVLSLMQTTNAQYGNTVPEEMNDTKLLARQLSTKIGFLISSEFLSGSTHVMANQINENAKHVAFPLVVPELNHHLLESLSYPTSNATTLHAVFFDSPLFDERNRKRLSITREVVGKNHISTSTYHFSENEKLLTAMRMLHFGSYVSFYLGMIHGVNPSSIPWVDYFKEQLKK
ncbi:MAG TPA: SIS domain-containing protein [Patescibacteria group bacterium]|nr:SIS domain-containing protein [Patescibacteria group bacterium]